MQTITEIRAYVIGKKSVQADITAPTSKYRESYVYGDSLCYIGRRTIFLSESRSQGGIAHCPSLPPDEVLISWPAGLPLPGPTFAVVGA